MFCLVGGSAILLSGIAIEKAARPAAHHWNFQHILERHIIEQQQISA
jgi:hypothetical protein